MKVALVHDWLIHMRGGERVLEALAELYPEAVIYTLFSDKRRLSPSLQRMKIKNSFLHYLPGIRRYYRWLLPILPWAIRTLRIESADIVISSSHCVAKGIPIPAGARHLCYCHTPMRYLWGFEDEYFSRYPQVVRKLIRAVLHFLRKWDLDSNRSVHQFVSNSENVKNRIRDYYGRDAIVVYPPVGLEQFYPEGPLSDYYLIVSAFVPYKRVDLVIEAFNELNRRLVIVGKGPLEKKYQNLRKSEKISFWGSVDDAGLRRLYSGAQAVLFPTFEDFGIVPLEAQACGSPVIALGQGGALESVKTGVFFKEQTVQALKSAVAEFETLSWDRSSIPMKIKSFGRSRFKEAMQQCVHGLNKAS
ncbi:MAG: glycosyltransferase [Candidatus Omnitrophica bacterium]|nr:glycosyltransferase [Candidatus Omnitrophota bacterium]